MGRRGNRHKLERERLRLGRKRNFFSALTVRPDNRLPRESMQSPSMEVLKTNLKPGETSSEITAELPSYKSLK